MDKRERIEKALAFEQLDRVPLTDSFQHAGVIAHYAGIRKREDWTLEEVCRATGNSLDMVQGWALSPSFEKGKITVDRHGVKWKQDTWFSWIIERPFSNADDYARAVEKEIARLRSSSPDYPEAIKLAAVPTGDELLTCKVTDFRETFLRYQRLIGGFDVA